MRERRQEQISKIVANQTVPGAEPILKQPAQQRFVFGERDHAVADIPRGEDAVFAAQPAGAAPVVRDGDDGSEVDDGPLARWIRVVARCNVELEAAEKGGEAGAAAKRYDTNPFLQTL